MPRVLMRKAFTLLELVVAVALLTMALSFSGVIFKIAIDARRTSSASAEIMRNLRALTSQLDSDFKGLQKDAPLAIRFEYNNATNLRHDQILFFANGDFQSIQLYLYNITDLVTVSGNVARIYYGQSGFINSKGTLNYKNAKSLVRRQHILTADNNLVYNFPDYQAGAGAFNAAVFTPDENNYYEYDLLSLAEWKTVPLWAYENQVMTVCIDTARPQVDMTNHVNLHMVMCQGISNLKIQVEERYFDGVSEIYIWRPDEDPYGDGSQNDFLPDPKHGWFFNVPDGADFIGLDGVGWLYLGSGFFPRAIKFTFTLHDSKDVIKNGRTFTHIVYIGN